MRIPLATSTSRRKRKRDEKEEAVRKGRKLGRTPPKTTQIEEWRTLKQCVEKGKLLRGS